jgi:cytochrome c oxidase assembly protein subunit 15
VPEGSRLFFNAPLWRNFFENTLTVQFDHRMTAYALELVVLLHAVDVARRLRGGAVLTGALALASVVTLQAALGIATLLHQAPLALALLHQAMALVVLAIAVIHAERVARAPARAREATHATPMRRGEQAT